MPYDSSGRKIKNPTRGQRAAYHKQKSQAKQIRKKASASNQGGGSIGGGTAAASGGS